MLLYPLLSLAFCGWVACQSTSEPDQSTSSDGPPVINRLIPAAELRDLLTQNSEVQLIDVRTAKEVSGGHISGAVNYDFYSGDFRQQLQQLDPTKTTVVYCKSGGRSGRTRQILKKMGFREVYDLEGGYRTWSAQQ